MSYANGGAVSVCDGSQTCGTPQAPLNCGTSCTFNTRYAPGNMNACSPLEFLDCTPPLYRNCSPNSSFPIAGSGSVIFQKDILGNANGGSWEGAYQTQCAQNSDCQVAAPVCNMVTNQCVQ